MSGSGQAIREGMEVYGSDDVFVGTVERLEGDGISVNGQYIPGTALGGVAQNRVYLQGAASTLTASKRDPLLTSREAEPRSLREALPDAAPSVEEQLRDVWTRPRGE